MRRLKIMFCLFNSVKRSLTRIDVYYPLKVETIHSTSIIKVNQNNPNVKIKRCTRSVEDIKGDYENELVH